jgi:hypothetical protein
VKKGTWLLLGWLLTNEETGRGRRGLAAVTHGGEGGVRRSVAAAADRQRPGAGGRTGRVGGHPKQGMPGWLPGGVSSTVLGDWIYFEFKFQPISNQFQIVSNFGWPKKDLPELKKFKTKYGYECFKERNNVLHRNFFRFEMDFE